jgi:lysophospholipid hydrolase
MNGYQLLNEVGSGGTLSSLFTILSLFTEDVKISWQDAAVDIETINISGDSGTQGRGHSTVSSHRASNTSVERGRVGAVMLPANSSGSPSTVSSASATVIPPEVNISFNFISRSLLIY